MSQSYVAALGIGFVVTLLVLGFALKKVKEHKASQSGAKAAPTVRNAALVLFQSAALTPITMYQVSQGRMIAGGFCLAVQTLGLFMGLKLLGKAKAARQN